VTGEAKAAKCTFCQDRLPLGLGPACVERCPTGALTWGNRQTLLGQAKNRVSDLQEQGFSQAALYGETQAGGLHRLSILLDTPATYGLPADPTAPITLSSVWQRVIQPLGGIAIGATIAAALVAWAVVRRNIRMEEVK